MHVLVRGRRTLGAVDTMLAKQAASIFNEVVENARAPEGGYGLLPGVSWSA